MNFRCYVEMLRSQKLVGAFDTNPSAAPLTGSKIAKRLHPDTEGFGPSKFGHSMLRF